MKNSLYVYMLSIPDARTHTHTHTCTHTHLHTHTYTQTDRQTLHNWLSSSQRAIGFAIPGSVPGPLAEAESWVCHLASTALELRLCQQLQELHTVFPRSRVKELNVCLRTSEAPVTFENGAREWEWSWAGKKVGGVKKKKKWKSVCISNSALQQGV